jgi:hypothetical protein
MVLGAENTPMSTQGFYFLQDAPKTLNSPENKKTERLRRMSTFEDAQVSSLFSTRRSISCFRARARQQIEVGDVPKTPSPAPSQLSDFSHSELAKNSAQQTFVFGAPEVSA